MVLILILLSFLSLNFCLNFTSNISKISVITQKLCLAQLPLESTYINFYSSIVCGKKITTFDPLMNLFINCSLIHIVVVSGSHLIIMNKFFSLIFKENIKLKNLLLFTYCLITGFQAPTIRAYLQILLHQFNGKFKKNWSPLQIQLYTFLTLLIFIPNWCLSLSFYLSAICALAIELTQQMTSLKKQCLIYLLILFPILTISFPHPASIFSNLIFAPVLELILFPLCLIATMIPYFYKLTDFILMIVEKILTHFWIFSSIDHEPLKVHKTLLGSYYFISILIFYFSKKQREINKC